MAYITDSNKLIDETVSKVISDFDWATDYKSNKKKPALIIGINGIAGAGKDTIANMVLLSLQNDHGMKAQCFAFADSLKKAASIIFNVPLELFYDRLLKEVEIAYWEMSPRQMAQRLGTEACRKGIRDDIWIRSLHSNIIASEVDVAFITDVRFDNEAEFVRQWKHENIGGGYIQGMGGPGIVIKIFRDNQSTIKDSNHASEAGINEKLIDYTILNVTGNVFKAASELQQIILNDFSKGERL